MTLEEAINLIGQGMRLRVDKQSKKASIVEGWINNPTIRRTIVINDYLRDALLTSKSLYLLQRETTDSRVGWEESGYDGDVADWYCLVM